MTRAVALAAITLMLAQQPTAPLRPPRPNQDVPPDRPLPGPRVPRPIGPPRRDADEAPVVAAADSDLPGGLSGTAFGWLEAPEEFEEALRAAVEDRDEAEGLARNGELTGGQLREARRAVRRLDASLTSRQLAVEEELELLGHRVEARRAAVRLAKTQLDQAQADLALVERLNRRVPGSTSPEEFRQAQTRVPARESEVALREAELKEVEARSRQLERRRDGYAAVRRRHLPAENTQGPPADPRRPAAPG